MTGVWACEDDRARVLLQVMGWGSGVYKEDVLMAGATAIEIGTANFLDPAVTIKVRDGINDWLDAHGCKSVKEIVGTLEG